MFTRTTRTNSLYISLKITMSHTWGPSGTMPLGGVIRCIGPPIPGCPETYETTISHQFVPEQCIHVGWLFYSSASYFGPCVSLWSSFKLREVERFLTLSLIKLVHVMYFTRLSDHYCVSKPWEDIHSLSEIFRSVSKCNIYKFSFSYSSLTVTEHVRFFNLCIIYMCSLKEWVVCVNRGVLKDKQISVYYSQLKDLTSNKLILQVSVWPQTNTAFA